MDYVEMIKDPELVLGFQELVSDTDPVVVKRTVKVFTSVYYHTLRLLANGEIEEKLLMQSWGSVKGVVDSLLRMVKQCDNEGILMHLLRFLEAAVMSHLMYDLSNYPTVFERGREVIKTGLKALKDLVTTPYVGGSTFIVGVKALISIACLRPDLWEPVTDLLKKQLGSLPPTLFDHNVRSLYKMLQRNLFRLLRRAETPDLKEKLVEMMVSVGVPRKIIAPWAPFPMETRKRSPPGPIFDDYFPGRVTPPDKKARLEPSGGEITIPSASSRSSTPEIPNDPRLPYVPEEQTFEDMTKPSKKTSPTDPSSKKLYNADLLFLTSLIPNTKKPESVEETPPTSFEKAIYERLNIDNVCTLVIQSMRNLPDVEPKDLPSLFEPLGNLSKDNVETKKSIATMVGRYLNSHGIREFPKRVESTLDVSIANSFDILKKTGLLRDPIKPVMDSDDVLKGDGLLRDPVKPVMDSNDLRKGSGLLRDPVKPVIDSNSSSAASTPSSTPPLTDTDLRQVYHPRPAGTAPSMGDIDMRVVDPRLAARDPRLSRDPRTRKTAINDPRINSLEVKESPRADPRLDSSKVVEQKQRTDPRLSSPAAAAAAASSAGTETSRKSAEQPRKTRWDPRTSKEIQNSSTSVSNTISSIGDGSTEVFSRPLDPRVKRNQHQTKGLLPLPNLVPYQQENTDPRLQRFGDHSLHQQQNFMNANPFGSLTNAQNSFNPPVVGSPSQRPFSGLLNSTPNPPNPFNGPVSSANPTNMFNSPNSSANTGNLFNGPSNSTNTLLPFNSTGSQVPFNGPNNTTNPQNQFGSPLMTNLLMQSNILNGFSWPGNIRNSSPFLLAQTFAPVQPGITPQQY